MFHDQTLLFIKKLKDGLGRYLWQSGLAGGVPDTLDDDPITINQSMASSIASGNKTVLYGDFSNFEIREVNEYRMYHLVERFRDSDQDAFGIFCRFDSNLVDAGDASGQVSGSTVTPKPKCDEGFVALWLCCCASGKTSAEPVEGESVADIGKLAVTLSADTSGIAPAVDGAKKQAAGLGQVREQPRPSRRRQAAGDQGARIDETKMVSGIKPLDFAKKVKPIKLTGEITELTEDDIVKLPKYELPTIGGFKLPKNLFGKDINKDDIEHSLPSLGDIGSGLLSRLGSLSGAAGKIFSGKIGDGVSSALGMLKGVPPIVGEVTEALGQVPGPGRRHRPGSRQGSRSRPQLPERHGHRGDPRVNCDGRARHEPGARASAYGPPVRYESRLGGGNATACRTRRTRPLRNGERLLSTEPRPSQARSGNIEAMASFENLGVSMAQVRTGDTAAILNTISTSVRNHGDAVENTGRLSEVFGRRGVAALTPLLYGEANALEEATRRAQTFGLVVTQADAASVSSANRRGIAWPPTGTPCGRDWRTVLAWPWPRPGSSWPVRSIWSSTWPSRCSAASASLSTIAAPPPATSRPGSAPAWRPSSSRWKRPCWPFRRSATSSVSSSTAAPNRRRPGTTWARRSAACSSGGSRRGPSLSCASFWA